jgi:hypothetical protein
MVYSSVSFPSKGLAGSTLKQRSSVQSICLLNVQRNPLDDKVHISASHPSFHQMLPDSGTNGPRKGATQPMEIKLGILGNPEVIVTE